MTLKQFANVDSYLRDLDNGKELEWREYMARVVGKIGIDNIKPYIPHSISFIREKLAKDENLNNIPLKEWDFAAERIHYLLHCNGIACYSLSERVCILKEAARILCENEENYEDQI
jgi:hypothetical protein